MADLQQIEKAIRDALAKVDAGDPKIRQRVYSTVWTAHERSLASSTELDEAGKGHRRERLKALIGSIESEFRSARPAAAPPAPGVRVEPAFQGLGPRQSPAASGEAAGEGLAGVSPGQRHAPSHPSRAAGDDIAIKMSRDDRTQQPRRRSFTMFFVVATLLVAVGIGVIWTIYSGILVPQSERGVPTAPVQLGSEDYSAGNGQGSGQGQKEPEAKWISVFTPDDPTLMSAIGGATAEIAKNGDEQFARLASSSPDGEVRFDVGQGILDQLAGGRAVFDITLQTEGDKPVQVAVRCDFGGLAVCERNRYEVGITRQDFLLEVDLPAGVHPQAGGTIVVNTDIASTGGKVDVYGIRVRAGQ